MGRIESEAYQGLIAIAAITDDFGLAVPLEKGDRDTWGTNHVPGKETNTRPSLGFVHEFRPLAAKPLAAKEVRGLLDRRWAPSGVCLP